jgi:3,4-dihydroxy 2-butanone 4-phosphate synthase/GTP cyclohydrolase II
MSGQPNVFAAADEAIELFRAGKLLILTDDEDRENEGDLIMAASAAAPDAINFMATHGRGLICLPSTAERLAQLDLPLMVPMNTALHGTNFTVSIDTVVGTSTGISASDRAKTIRAFVSPDTHAGDFGRPGHIFPLMAAKGGVLKRAGHTEGVVDLARLAGDSPAGVLCEILREDGSMARMPELIDLALRFGLKIVTIRDLIEYRMRTEKLVRRIVTTRLPNEYGEWTLYLYESAIEPQHDHLALVMGDVTGDQSILVRVHSQCFTGDTLGSHRCDCHAQLHAAMARIADEGRGVVLYLGQEGRGIGLRAKLMAYALQDQGRDTVEANEDLGFRPDQRDYGIGAQVLADIGLHKIRVMTNNPRKLVGLSGYHLEITERVPIVVGVGENNRRYLQTKRDKLGHLLFDTARGEKQEGRGESGERRGPTVKEGPERGER